MPEPTPDETPARARASVPQQQATDPVLDTLWAAARPYAWTAAATLVAAAANHLIIPLTGGRAPFLPFYPTIAIVAFVFGARAGAVALLLTVALVLKFWLPASGPLDVEELATVGFFTALSIGLIWAADRYRALQARNADALLQLEAAERRFRVAQDASDVPFTLLAAIRDQSGRIVDFEWTYANAAAGRVLKRPPERLVGRRLLAELPGNRQQSELFRRYVHVVETGRGHDLELRYEADGIDGWFRNLATRLDDGVAIWFMDVTAQKRLERSLRDQTERLQLAVDGAVLGTWYADLRTGRCVWNERHFQLGGLPVTPAPTVDDWFALVHPDDRPKLLAIYERLRREGGDWRPQYRIVRADTGETRWIEAYGRVLPDEDGAPTRFVGVFADVTERKLAEEELHRRTAELQVEVAERLRAEESLRDADRRKDVFLATLAHELRNPLAPARYALRLLRPDVPVETAAEARRIIERQLAQMARLIDDLLDINRITRGIVDLRLEPIDARAVVTAAVETARPALDAARHRLTVTLPDAPLPVHGDATRLAQAIGNLLNNAAKYTDPGGRIEVVGAERDGWVEITVTDDGIGIPRQMLPRVFEMFAQVDGHAPRSQGGLGIGLALSRSLVCMHGGTLEAASDGPGCGSRFTMRLPRRDAAAPTSAPATENVVPLFRGRRRVVIADDNVDAARSLAEVLELAGYVTHVAHDGLAAVELSEVLHPDVLLLDIGMPKLSGYDAARLLRRHPWCRDSTLIAITGWGQHDDRERSREAGFDLHLTKPVDPDELLRILAATGPRPTPDAPPASDVGTG